MAAYFADTSFWIALVDRRDSHHSDAARWARTMSGRLTTTEAVLLETANAFSKPQWRPQAITLINHIKGRVDIDVVAFSDDLWRHGWHLFARRPDKSWSLTDCFSFEVMRERGLVDALTADVHFQQAGFGAMLITAP